MKKQILTIILSLSLFFLADKIECARNVPPGMSFTAGVNFKVTDTKLNLNNRTNITDDQLASILGRIGGNLRELRINSCHRLRNFSSIANCPNLQVLGLKRTNITDDQLAYILGRIGGSLKQLRVVECRRLTDFASIANCPNLQELTLSDTEITDGQLTAILDRIGGSLKVLRIRNCPNLKDFSSIANCPNLQVLQFSDIDLFTDEHIDNVTDEQLAYILGQIGGSLRKLELYFCNQLSPENMVSLKAAYPKIKFNY